MRSGWFFILLILPLLTGCGSTRSYTMSVKEAQSALHSNEYERGGELLQSLLDRYGEKEEVLTLALEHALITSEYESALHYIDLLIVADPAGAAGYQKTKGALLDRLGRYEEEISLYRSLWEMDRYDSDLGLTLIRLLSEQGHTAEAYEVSLALYAFHPDLIELLEYLAAFDTPRQEGWKEVLEYNSASR